MPPSVISAFLVFTFITAFTPGPNNVLALSTGIQRGFRGSLPVVAGISTGFFCVMILCCSLVFSLSTLSSELMRLVRYAGCLYIVWLAWKIATAVPKEEAHLHSGTDFLTGLVLQFANVKIMIYGMTACSGFILPWYDSIPALLAGACILTLIGASGVLTWALAGSILQRLFRQHTKVMNIILAILLLSCLIPMLFPQGQTL